MPRFFNPRPTPYALVDKVKAELDRFEQDGVTEKVETTDRTTPIVVVPKKYGGIRLCGDYKETVNPFLLEGKYPLACLNDIFASLKNNKYFPKLHLSHVYHQPKLEENSKKLIIISTPFGLYQYSQLPFVVTIAPSKFSTGNCIMCCHQRGKLKT